MLSDIGLIGLAVMGENLVLNIENKGFSASVFNRSTEKIDKFLKDRGSDKKFYGAKDIGDFCSSLATPRKLLWLSQEIRLIELSINYYPIWMQEILL